MKNIIGLPVENSAKKITLKIFGVGGAGCNVIDFMARNDSGDARFMALNTDAASLERCAVAEKFCLGEKIIHGYSTGGDPEMGRAVAETDFETLRESCAGAKIVVIVAGMGGGTGTGASSVLARAAKEAGAVVLGVVVLPFEFEGSRRQRQAQLGFQQLKAAADAVLCFPNQKLFRFIDGKTSVLDAFKSANEFLAQGVNGLARLLQQTGLINVDFVDLVAVAKKFDVETVFVSAEVSGENRPAHIMEKLLAHPILENGKSLDEAESLLVSVGGGADLTMSEINVVMENIRRHCENAHIIFGATIDESLEGRLSVTLVVAGRTWHEEKIAASVRPTRVPSLPVEPDAQLIDTSEPSRSSSRMVPPAPEMSEEKKEQVLTKQTGSRARRQPGKMRQNELPLEIISKGRFEKSEPTIHRGEDLDLPTYIRRGAALN
ncbi:MAG: cell division protein FtsZ [Verrucomicrobiota bacterium]